MNGADVDDGECDHLMRALSQNTTIRSLSLSRNLVGDQELLNVVNPDLVTGGEAIASMLLANKTLKALDVSWNKIRLSRCVDMVYICVYMYLCYAMQVVVLCGNLDTAATVH